MMPTGDTLRKFVIALVAGLIAIGSGVALTHVGRGPDKAAVEQDTPTVGEGRNLTREVLRSRREHAEALAEVRPDPSLGARVPIVNKEAAAKEAKELLGVKDAPKPKAAAVVLPRSRPVDNGGEPLAQGQMASLAPPNTPAPNMPTPNATVPSEPILGEAAPEQSRSFGSVVFSTVSDLSGKAANFTGDTANFVIDLPGKLIAAGGRLFERPQSAPPKREAL
jgi:hypothetical protein